MFSQGFVHNSAKRAHPRECACFPEFFEYFSEDQILCGVCAR